MQIYYDLYKILYTVFNFQNVVKDTNDRGIMTDFADNISLSYYYLTFSMLQFLPTTRLSYIYTKSIIIY